MKGTEEIDRKIEEVYPLHDGVLVKSFVVDEVTKGGIYLAEETIKREKATMKDDQFRRVVATGPECKNIKPGYDVMFGRSTPMYMNFQGVEYMLFFEHQATCIHSKEKVELVDNSRNNQST